MSDGISSVLNHRVNIISKAQIRYEGILIDVNTDLPNDPVITLSQVVSHGTETRPVSRYIAPKSAIYEKITFRGKDLEDISLVFDEQILNDDPSIVSTGPTSIPPPNDTKSPGKVATSQWDSPQASNSLRLKTTAIGEEKKSGLSDHSRNDNFNEQNVKKEDNHQKQFADASHTNGSAINRNNYRGGVSNHYQHGRNFQRFPGHNRYQNRSGYSDATKFDEDYDLEEANKLLAAELEKMHLHPDETESVTSSAAELDNHATNSGTNFEGEHNNDDAGDSFFDSLSCEIIDKAKGIQKDGISRRDERRLNIDTFGNSAIYFDNRRGGGYRPRGFNRGGGNNSYRNNPNYGQNSGPSYRPSNIHGGRNNFSPHGGWRRGGYQGSGRGTGFSNRTRPEVA